MISTMKALRITGKLEMSIRAEEIPVPEKDQIRIKVAYAGICGSDLHYYFDGANGAFIVKEPLIPGHELSGTVDFDPKGEWKSGTKVTIHPGRPGKKLDFIADKPHLWPQGSYLGSASTSPHTQGGMCEFLIVERFMVRELPDELELKVATLAEPLAVGIHAIRISEKDVGSISGKSILVSGSGPIGLLVVAACKVFGARYITATDVVDGALNRAKILGANAVINVKREEIPLDNFDVVFECSGNPRAITSAIGAVRKSGTIVQVGMLPSTDLPVNLSNLVIKEAKLMGTFRFNNEINDAIVMLSQNKWIDQAITHNFPIERAVEGFEMARDSEKSGKVLISI